MISGDTLARIRVVVLGAAGAICALYSLGAFALDTPRPFAWWLPAVAGVSAAVVITLSFLVAGRESAEMATDELYRAEWGRAVQLSYWFGLALFLLGAVAVSRGWIGQSTAIAALGTAYGAAPMLAFCAITLRS